MVSNKIMSKEAALEKYTKLVEKRNEHIKANKTVFDDHEKIVMDIIDAENDLRDAVAESKEGVSNAEFTVTVTPQKQVWADIETLDKFVASGNITKEMRDMVVKTQDRPPKISIKKN